MKRNFYKSITALIVSTVMAMSTITASLSEGIGSVHVFAELPEVGTSGFVNTEIFNSTNEGQYVTQNNDGNTSTSLHVLENTENIKVVQAGDLVNYPGSEEKVYVQDLTLSGADLAELYFLMTGTDTETSKTPHVSIEDLMKEYLGVTDGIGLGLGESDENGEQYSKAKEALIEEAKTNFQDVVENAGTIPLGENTRNLLKGIIPSKNLDAAMKAAIGALYTLYVKRNEQEAFMHQKGHYVGAGNVQVITEGNEPGKYFDYEITGDEVYIDHIPNPLQISNRDGEDLVSGIDSTIDTVINSGINYTSNPNAPTLFAADTVNKRVSFNSTLNQIDPQKLANPDYKQTQINQLITDGADPASAKDFVDYMDAIANGPITLSTKVNYESFEIEIVPKNQGSYPYGYATETIKIKGNNALTIDQINELNPELLYGNVITVDSNEIAGIVDTIRENHEGETIQHPLTDTQPIVKTVLDPLSGQTETLNVTANEVIDSIAAEDKNYRITIYPNSIDIDSVTIGENGEEVYTTLYAFYPEKNYIDDMVAQDPDLDKGVRINANSQKTIEYVTKFVSHSLQANHEPDIEQMTYYPGQDLTVKKDMNLSTLKEMAGNFDEYEIRIKANTEVTIQAENAAGTWELTSTKMDHVPTNSEMLAIEKAIRKDNGSYSYTPAELNSKAEPMANEIYESMQIGSSVQNLIQRPASFIQSILTAGSDFTIRYNQINGQGTVTKKSSDRKDVLRYLKLDPLLELIYSGDGENGDSLSPTYEFERSMEEAGYQVLTKDELYKQLDKGWDELNKGTYDKDCGTGYPVYGREEDKMVFDHDGNRIIINNASVNGIDWLVHTLSGKVIQEERISLATYGYIEISNGKWAKMSDVTNCLNAECSKNGIYYRIEETAFANSQDGKTVDPVIVAVPVGINSNIDLNKIMGTKDVPIEELFRDMMADYGDFEDDEPPEGSEQRKAWEEAKKEQIEASAQAKKELIDRLDISEEYKQALTESIDKVVEQYLSIIESYTETTAEKERKELTKEEMANFYEWLVQNNYITQEEFDNIIQNPSSITEEYIKKYIELYQMLNNFIFTVDAKRVIIQTSSEDKTIEIYDSNIGSVSWDSTGNIAMSVDSDGRGATLTPGPGDSTASATATVRSKTVHGRAISTKEVLLIDGVVVYEKDIHGNISQGENALLGQNFIYLNEQDNGTTTISAGSWSFHIDEEETDQEIMMGVTTEVTTQTGYWYNGQYVLTYLDYDQQSTKHTDTTNSFRIE